MTYVIICFPRKKVRRQEIIHSITWNRKYSEALFAVYLHSVLCSLVEDVRYVGRRVIFETIAAVLLKIQVPYDVTLCLFVNVIDVSKNLSTFYL
jgi:hypothetical protein